MAKPIMAVVKLQVPAGQATPAPPVGTALGPHGVNIMEFVKQFNAKTAQAQGMITPVEVTIFKDRTFTFITRPPPGAVLVKKEAGMEKGSRTSNRQKVGKVTRAQLRKIAELKMPDLNANDIEAAMNMVAGTARSMGVEGVEGCGRTAKNTARRSGATRPARCLPPARSGNAVKPAASRNWRRAGAWPPGRAC